MKNEKNRQAIGIKANRLVGSPTVFSFCAVSFTCNFKFDRTSTVKIRMPGMGEGHGKVLEWYKQKGDIIRQEDILCDIETKV